MSKKITFFLTTMQFLSFSIEIKTGDGDMENSIVLQPNQTIENRGDKSYLIVWQI